MKLFSIKDIVLIGIFAAITFLATAVLNIQLPISINGGLIHLGTPVIIITSLVFGPKVGSWSGAIGMTIFDLASGWAIWAPGTFVARFLMGYIIGKLAWKSNKLSVQIIAIFIGSCAMIISYYIWETILIQSFIVPLTSIPGNLIQVATGYIIGLPIALVLKKILKKNTITN